MMLRRFSAASFMLTCCLNCSFSVEENGTPDA